MLSNVGTNMAMFGMASSLIKYSSAKVYFIDVLGEFSKFNVDNNLYIRFLKINHIVPTTGKISKLLIFLISILSIPFLVAKVIKHKPDIIITGLVGFIPSILKYFLNNLIVINSIQGYPKFSLIRKFIWKLFYKKSDFLITMTNKTKKDIEETIGIKSSKIVTIQNPILNRNIKKMSLEEIDADDQFIFKKNVICSIGRLTHQKNFIELLNFVREINKSSLEKFNFIIIGEGEKRSELKNFIKRNNLYNCYLLGFKKNPYKYLARSKLYISTSLWEEPGHTLLEAGYLNVPILSSNCPNGPNEIIKNEITGLKYELHNKQDLLIKFKKFLSLSDPELFFLKKNMKRIVLDYTSFRFYKKILKIIN